MSTPKLLYRIPEAAELLGVTSNTVYRLIAAGQLRAVDVDASGRRPRTRVRHDDLQAFVDARTAA